MILNEKYNYTKLDLVKRIAEMLRGTYLFAFKKDPFILSAIIHDMLTDDFMEMFRVDMWFDLSERDSKFHDMILLVRQIEQVKRLNGNKSVTPEFGKKIMQDLVDLTAKLVKHDYSVQGMDEACMKVMREISYK